MKKGIKILLIAIAFVGFSCDKSSSTPSFVGTSDCQIKVSAQDVACEMSVTEASGVFSITISGSQISPTIALTGVTDGSNIAIDPCLDECYQGDMNVSSGDLKFISGKKVLNFGIYDPVDQTPSDAINVVVEEI